MDSTATEELDQSINRPIQQHPTPPTMITMAQQNQQHQHHPKRDESRRTVAFSSIPESITSASVTNNSSSSSAASKMPHSGLSALILAATSQLGPLAEGATQCSDDMSSIAQISHAGDGYTSSHDGEQGMRPSTPSSSQHQRSRTTSIGDEAEQEDDGRHHSFPEVLMTLLLDPNNGDIMTFLPDGKFFAMRSKEFAEQIMPQHFKVASFEEFLELVHDWGFTRIDDGSNDENTTVCSGIQVFRHPQFQRHSRSYMSMKYGQSPTEVRMAVIPPQARIELSLSEDSMVSSSLHQQQQQNSAEGSTGSNPKRRLSPSHLRRHSETSTTSQKQRTIGFELPDMPSQQGGSLMMANPSVAAAASAIMGRRGSMDSSGERLSMSRRASMESRSIALAITTEKLNLESTDTVSRRQSLQQQQQQQQPATNALHLKPLVDDGVERATRNIVGDAIESLLWDENHTRETFLKHEKALSTSTLPGVVPISKQLFSVAAAVAAAGPAETIHHTGHSNGHSSDAHAAAVPGIDVATQTQEVTDDKEATATTTTTAATAAATS